MTTQTQSGFLTDWKNGKFPNIDTIVKQIRPNRADYRELRQHIRDRFALEWTQGAENGLTLEQARKQALIGAQNRADSINSNFAPIAVIRQWHKAAA